jgi:DNA-binding NarL/FixJ family response regulator
MDRTAHRFLIVDQSAARRFFFSGALSKKFSQMALFECASVEVALELTRISEADAIIVHPMNEIEGPALVRSLRTMNAATPIVVMAASERTSLPPGASAVLGYSKWSQLATIVAGLLGGGCEHARAAIDAA